AFPVSRLGIEDQSSGCGFSYAVLLVSEVCAFKGKTTLARHRSINQALKQEISRLHASSEVSFWALSATLIHQIYLQKSFITVQCSASSEKWLTNSVLLQRYIVVFRRKLYE
ncbi:hypothetical protein BDR04DRAFT_1029945, partial [Suillus decipiens]